MTEKQIKVYALVTGWIVGGVLVIAGASLPVILLAGFVTTLALMNVVR